MNLDEFATANRARCEAADGFNHPLGSWSASDWMTATLGELGEAANVIKKLNRVRDGIPGNAETPEQLQASLADELADAFIYLDLLTQSLGIHLAEAVRQKFDRTSAKIGYTARLAVGQPDLQARYDVLLKEMQRERAEHEATRVAHAGEVAALRLALGLNPVPAVVAPKPRSMEA